MQSGILQRGYSRYLMVCCLTHARVRCAGITLECYFTHGADGTPLNSAGYMDQVNSCGLAVSGGSFAAAKAAPAQTDSRIIRLRRQSGGRLSSLRTIQWRISFQSEPSLRRVLRQRKGPKLKFEKECVVENDHQAETVNSKDRQQPS